MTYKFKLINEIKVKTYETQVNKSITKNQRGT